MASHTPSSVIGFSGQFLLCLVILGGLAAWFGASDARAAGLPVPERGFVSVTPAETWEQGLISGNGVIGANALSRPLDETIIFTHERLFLPMGGTVPPPDTASRLFEVRRLIDRGLYKQATLLAFQLSGQDGFMYPDPFVPAFDMQIKTSAKGEVRDYMRSVDFQTGVATVHWADDRGAFERRLFVSRPDGVAVLQITGPGKGAIDCTLKLTPRQLSPKLGEKTVERSNARFQSHVSDVQAAADASFLTFTNNFTKAYPGSIQSMNGVARVIAPGAKVAAKGDTMTVRGADRVLVLVRLEPVYKAKSSHVDAIKQALGKIAPDYKALLKRHAAIHGEMFNRMRLDIGGGADHRKTTEVLLKESTNENLNRALTEKCFDAGRYNIISCIGELPPTLQGVWAGTYVPAWASDFTQNGNVPSAIAALMRGNTPELMLAYTGYIEDMVPYMRVNAKHIFGARGHLLPSRTSATAYNNALAPGFAGGMWVAGSAWAAHFFYDYYLYTGDKKFLVEHAMPFMEEAALFFEDYLYEGPDGKWVFNPSTSPENSPSNTRSQACLNSTMDVDALRELLNNLIAASNMLKTNQDKIPVWKKMLAKLPDYMYNDQGMVKEWLTPKLDDALNHRHSSHLYALYDGLPDYIARNPKLREGFRKIIEHKLEHHYKRAGFMSFGVVQLGQAATSLGEGELAYLAMVRLVNSYWLDNLASMHNHRSLFNMDISGGMPAVLIKMMLRSEPGEVTLLPALPRQWPAGTLEGALCRGRIEVEKLQWKPGKITATLRSGMAQTITLTAPAAIRKITASANVSIKKADSNSARRVTLPQDKPVTFEIEME